MPLRPPERYLRVALALGRLHSDLVEGYTGPPELAADLGDPTPQALAAEAAALREELGDGLRERWIAAQLRGIECACAVLGGERLSYPERVQRCYGVAPVEVDESVYEAAHQRLDEALPGPRPLRERFALWQATQTIPPGHLGAALAALTSALRERTRERFGLPEGEDVEIEIVTGRPWMGFSESIGNLRSRVSINADLPQPGYRLLELAAHEIYPGHHTEGVHKEGLGRPELDIYVYPSPQALVAEGLAMTAQDALLGAEADAFGATVLGELGLPYDAEIAAVAAQARAHFTTVRTNINLRMDDGRMDEAGARAYARRWLLEPDDFVEALVDSLIADPWPPYASCYSEGMALARAFSARHGFGRLLREQLTTADLTAR